MAVVALVVVAIGLGVYGYYRGARRFLLDLLPLVLASLLLWLFGPALYRIDGLRSMGLFWPAFMLVMVATIGGYGLRYVASRKLAKECRRGDRIGGAVAGVFCSFMVVWLGCVYVTVWSASRPGGTSGGSAQKMARVLDSALLRWVPGVGSGSTAMMGMLEISTADEEVRQRAFRELGFDNLLEVAEVQAIQNDPATKADVEAAAGGSLAALWRLQKNPRIVELLDNDEIRETITRHSVDEIAATVRDLKKESGRER